MRSLFKTKLLYSITCLILLTGCKFSLKSGPNSTSSAASSTSTANGNANVTSGTCNPIEQFSCAVLNGTGTHTMNCGTTPPTPNACLVQSCNSGFTQVGNSCAPTTCQGPSQQSCNTTDQNGAVIGIGTQGRSCVGGIWTPFGSCNVTSCSNGFTLVNNTCVPTTCSGPSQQSCNITDQNGAVIGMGTQERSCLAGIWTPFGSCNVTSCSNGFTLVNNTCVPTTCSGPSQQSCPIANGTGQQTRTCSNGVWSTFGSCTVTSCSSGYTQSGNSCVANNLPVIGSFENISAQNVATGWCADPNSPSTAIEYAGYVDGTTATGQLAFQGVTNISRPSINGANNLSGNHGFSHTIPASFLNSGLKQLYLYCKDLNSNSWTLLSNSPLSFGSSANNTIAQIRVKNPSVHERNSVVTTMVTFNEGAYTDQTLSAQGFTLDGKPTVAIPIEHFWENGAPTNKVASAKFISQPINFGNKEEKILDLRAEGVPQGQQSLTENAGFILSEMHEEFYIEIELLNGEIYRAIAGVGTGEAIRQLELSHNHMVIEYRTRFKNITNGNILPGMLAGFYITAFAGQDTVELKVQISNGDLFEPINGGVTYRKLSFAYNAAANTQFSFKKHLYGVNFPDSLPNGWESYCLDGCPGKMFETGNVFASSTEPMNRGVIGDGQTYLLSGALTNIPTNQIQNTIQGTTHLAEGHHRLYGLQLYNYQRSTGGSLTGLNYYPDRRYNESTANNLRNADSNLCDMPINHVGHIARLYEFAPVNPGGTGFQPQFSTNRIPNVGWEILFKESNCQLYDFLAKYEIGESIRPQFFFEDDGNGFMAPMIASQADPKNNINWWSSRFFNGNGQNVNQHSPHLLARSGSNWNPGIRRLEAVNFSNVAFIEDFNKPTGYDNQHYEVGFASFAYQITGHPMYKAYVETMLSSVYLEYFNDWAMGLNGGPWNRIDAERAFGRTTMSALWLMRSVDNSSVVPLLQQKIPQKVSTLLPLAQQNFNSFGIASIEQENAAVWSIPFCNDGLYAVPNAYATQNCSWYANNNATYTPHWQWGLRANALTNMILMDIGRQEALDMTKLYLDSITSLHDLNTGRPKVLVLHQDINDSFYQGYHTWWIAPTIMALKKALVHDPSLQTHPNWQYVSTIQNWYEQNSKPFMQNIPENHFMDAYRIPLQ